jgi:hypothetical protein
MQKNHKEIEFSQVSKHQVRRWPYLFVQAAVRRINELCGLPLFLILVWVPAVQAQASVVNVAYRTLKCPFKRAEYMLRRMGFNFENETSVADADFMMEVRAWPQCRFDTQIAASSSMSDIIFLAGYNRYSAHFNQGQNVCFFEVQANIPRPTNHEE